MLVRAYHETGDHQYLESAIRGLQPFTRSVHGDSDKPCGVRTFFLGNRKFPWYEEYPVVPSIFVLNGFIFSLVGLFDLSHVRKN